VDEKRFETSLKRRSWDNLALCSGRRKRGRGAGSAAFDLWHGTRFNVNGSRAYATASAGCTDINDHANGTPGGSAGTNLGVDGVQEFKINTLVAPAEFGRSSGGVISESRGPAPMTFMARL